MTEPNKPWLNESYSEIHIYEPGDFAYSVISDTIIDGFKLCNACDSAPVVVEIDMKNDLPFILHKNEVLPIKAKEGAGVLQIHFRELPPRIGA